LNRANELRELKLNEKSRRIYETQQNKARLQRENLNRQEDEKLLKGIKTLTRIQKTNSIVNEKEKLQQQQGLITNKTLN
jgi:hypothetical protein